MFYGDRCTGGVKDPCGQPLVGSRRTSKMFRRTNSNAAKLGDGRRSEPRRVRRKKPAMIAPLITLPLLALGIWRFKRDGLGPQASGSTPHCPGCDLHPHWH